MSKILVIVESPGKIKKIQHILGSNYIVCASYGHIIDLDDKTMSIDINHDFLPIYKPTIKGKGVIADLKSNLKKSSDVLLAMDEDREGEMIAWSIADVLKLKNPKRIVFNSVTETELLNAVNNPKTIDNNMVDAQKVRRILDRLVGYEISPLLWRTIHASSAGRVQSVVVKLIIDRENEIAKFMNENNESYFKFKATFELKKNELQSVLYNIDKISDGIFKGSITMFKNKNESMNFLKLYITSSFKIENIFNKPSFSNPSQPFTTSTLQQESHRKLGLDSKRTMQSAQTLYEEGLITYMRTDSVNLSKEALDNIQEFVVSQYGEIYHQKREHKSKSNNTQEAHEAIRPTNVFKLPNDIINNPKIKSDELRLYTLIWKRTVASQMAQAKYDILSIQISISKDNKHFFLTSIKNLIFDGYLKVYDVPEATTGDMPEATTGDMPKTTTGDMPKTTTGDMPEATTGDMPNLKKEQDDDNMFIKDIKDIKKGTLINAVDVAGIQEYERPPSRYNEASLIDKMDPKNLNIGRPATYTSIISKIQEREYVKIMDIEGSKKEVCILSWKINCDIKEKINTIIIGKETKKFVPTELGATTTEFLNQNFPSIMEYKFTADMEINLDNIAEGKISKSNVLKNFYGDFHNQIIKLQEDLPILMNKEAKLIGNHPETGFEIVATKGKYGPILKYFITKSKPLIAPINKPLTINTITMEDALKLFEYPKNLGKYNRQLVILKKGKFGFYVNVGTDKFAVPNENIILDDIVKMIEEKNKKNIAVFQNGKISYTVLLGPYGHYVNVKDTSKKTKPKNIKLSKKISDDITNLTLEILEEHIKSFKKYKSSIKKTDNESFKQTENKVSKEVKIPKPTEIKIPKEVKIPKPKKVKTPKTKEVSKNINDNKLPKEVKIPKPKKIKTPKTKEVLKNINDNKLIKSSKNKKN